MRLTSRLKVAPNSEKNLQTDPFSKPGGNYIYVYILHICVHIYSQAKKWDEMEEERVDAVLSCLSSSSQLHYVPVHLIKFCPGLTRGFCSDGAR